MLHGLRFASKWTEFTKTLTVYLQTESKCGNLSKRYIIWQVWILKYILKCTLLFRKSSFKVHTKIILKYLTDLLELVPNCWNYSEKSTYLFETRPCVCTNPPQSYNMQSLPLQKKSYKAFSGNLKSYDLKLLKKMKIAISKTKTYEENVQSFFIIFLISTCFLFLKSHNSNI